MKNLGIGVVEGFFGPQWSNEARFNYAGFLKAVGADFFIYAPKQDGYLRKKWREPWPSSYIDHLNLLIRGFQAEGITFGVALSPFGLEKHLSDEDKNLLKEKITILSDLGVDVLGLFFDDMPSFPELADVQIEVVSFIDSFYKGKLIFCPTFYTFDPILEKVFGKMPDQYFEKISRSIPQSVEFAWTGPKVISPEISIQHLKEVEALLKRRPFIWENIFANDGPKNCKFLKIKPFSGREKGIMQHTSGMGLNLMNQPFLSQILFLAAKSTLIDGRPENEALHNSIFFLCSERFAQFLERHKDLFLEKGLASISDEERSEFIKDLSSMDDAGAKEIIDWLEGQYSVGSECLTD